MKRGWPERWQQPGAWALVSRPLSWVYGLLWWALKGLRTLRAPASVEGLRVLSVGNLSVGGTGKSALVREVVKAAQKRRLRTAILLRGYGARRGARPLWVSRGKGALVTAAFSGDEAQEHARLPGVGVLIDADRLRGAKEARAQGYEVLVLDDGFQRRWQLARHSDLLLATGPEIQRGERLLPWGPWREPWSQAAQAQILCLQEAPTPLVLPAPWRAMRCLPVGYAPKRLWTWHRGRLSAGPALSRLKGRPILALSGLGQPWRFEASLKALGAKVLTARFADHHGFSQVELDALDARGAGAVVTTMKDAMRLPAAWEPALPVWALEAELASSPKAALTQCLEQILR